LTLGVIMTPNVIRRIITDNVSCVMLKHEDWPGLEKISSPGDLSKRASCAAFRF
jgi:4-hydroxy-tetrahydrodipicolinate synthase